MMKFLLSVLSASLFFCAPVRAQSEAELMKMLGMQNTSTAPITTGINGAIPLESILKLLENIKLDTGKELGATDDEYNEAAQYVSSNTQCTDSSCEVGGSDDFLGNDRKLDAAINMGESGDEPGLKIDLKLIDTKTGKVIKTVSEPFDPNSKESFNQASMRAAKKITEDSQAKPEKKDKKNGKKTAPAPES